MTSEKFWYTDASVLFRSDTWYLFVPRPDMTVAAALNAVVRFSVYLTVLLTVTTMRPGYILMIPIVMFATILLNGLFPQARKMKEPFASGPVVSSYVGNGESEPTEDNPFMNPPLTDILDNPNRPPAADVTRVDVRDQVNKNFAKTSNIYMDTTDVFDLVQSQRNFYTVPTDDHKGFLEFLGKNAKSDKILNEGYVVAKGTMA